MKKYEENMKKYEEIMKEYEENMKKYERNIRTLPLDQSGASIFRTIQPELIRSQRLYMCCGTWKNSGLSSIYMVCETPPLDQSGASIPLEPSPRDSHSSLSVVVSNGT